MFAAMSVPKMPRRVETDNLFRVMANAGIPEDQVSKVKAALAGNDTSAQTYTES